MKTEAVFSKYITEVYWKSMVTDAVFTNTLSRHIRKIWRLKLYLPIHYRGILKKYEESSGIYQIHYRSILEKYGD